MNRGNLTVGLTGEDGLRGNWLTGTGPAIDATVRVNENSRQHVSVSMLACQFAVSQYIL